MSRPNRFILPTSSNIIRNANAPDKTDEVIARSVTKFAGNVSDFFGKVFYSNFGVQVPLPVIEFKTKPLLVTNDTHEQNLMRLFYVIQTAGTLLGFFFSYVSEVRKKLNISTIPTEIDDKIEKSQLVLYVTSCYRPEDTKSLHSVGKAVDIGAIGNKTNNTIYNINDYSMMFADMASQYASIFLNEKCPIMVAAVLYLFYHFAQEGFKWFVTPHGSKITTRSDAFFPFIQYISPVGNLLRTGKTTESTDLNKSPMIKSHNVHITQTPLHLNHMHISGGLS